MMRRPYFRHTIEQLEALFVEHRGTGSTLRLLHEELRYRTTPRAKALRKNVELALQSKPVSAQLPAPVPTTRRAGALRKNVELALQSKPVSAQLPVPVPMESSAAQRDAKFAGTTPLEGMAYIAVALALVALAMAKTSIWWILFVAFAVAMRGVRILAYHRQRNVTPAGRDLPARLDSRDPRDVRIDEICDRLKAAIRDAPDVARDFLSKPEETVELLRKTSHDLVKREISLRSLGNQAEIDRLSHERNQLQILVNRESDERNRQRVIGTLTALDNQLAEYADARTSADRLKVEREGLEYRLEGLYAQVMRITTAHGGSAELANVDRFCSEMKALADAMEQDG